MKRPLLLSTMVSLWLLGCAGIVQKKSSGEDFARMWSPIISYLNQEPGAQNEIIGYPSEDLMLKNEAEIKSIEDSWRKLSRKDPVNELKQKNQFFHHEVSTLNQATLEPITRKNHQSEPPLKDYQAIAKEILKAIESSTVASSKNVHVYDQGDQIGFCFGRALLVHYLLLKAGVPQKDMFKIFALGDLLVGGQFWRFHVAVVVRGHAGFMVVDPLAGVPMVVSDWVAEVSRLEVKSPLHRARFYVTDPRKFLPASGIYQLSSLLEPELKLYFQNLGAEIALNRAPGFSAQRP